VWILVVFSTMLFGFLSGNYLLSELTKLVLKRFCIYLL
jgi:hypothetical protein